MAQVLNPITSCLKKGEAMESQSISNMSHKEMEKETEKSNVDESPSSQAQAGLLWRVSSGLYNIGSGAVGLGVGSVKWAASTTYNVGTGVVSATQNVVSKVTPRVKPKSKKE